MTKFIAMNIGKEHIKMSNKLSWCVYLIYKRVFLNRVYEKKSSFRLFIRDALCSWVGDFVAFKLSANIWTSYSSAGSNLLHLDSTSNQTLQYCVCFLKWQKDTQNCMGSVTDGNGSTYSGNNKNELWVADCYYAYRQTPQKSLKMITLA